MRRSSLSHFARLALLPLLAATPLVHALSLDFGEGPVGNPSICSDTADGLGVIDVCGNFSFLSQTYGDVAGVVDVTYSAPRLTNTSLRWWASDYNSLFGVAWADSSDSDSRARIELKPLAPGAGVRLTSFDLGAYPNNTLNTTVNIYAIGGVVPLFTFTGAVGNGAVAPTSFAVNVASANGLWIEWQDSAFNVGIDHIQYTVGAVPEPASVALLLAGLAAIGATALRRRS